MTHPLKLVLLSAMLAALSSYEACADSSRRGPSSGDHRYPEGYDYNVPLSLPPYGYTPGFWGYGGRRYYDRFGNYRKYGQPGEPGNGPVESRPLR
jgi:hypothetical protein